MKRVIIGFAALAAVALAPSAAGAQDAVQITLLHGIPGATVDVAVDGEIVIPGFEPGDTQDLSAFAGQTLVDVEVRAAGTDDVVIGPVPEFAVPASGNWTVVAHLDGDGTPTITPFENDVSATAAGQGRLTVRHTAAAPAVDLVVGDARPIENAANGASAALELPAGEIAGARLAPTGADPIIDVPTVTLAEGTNLVVYAVGSLDDETFTFYTQQIAIDGAAVTAVPTQVNTGDEIEGAAGTSVNITLLAAAAGLAALAGGSLALRRRSVRS